jgi:RNA polymerase sigma factor (TIGR02999 family)
MAAESEVTRLLDAASSGDRNAMDRLVPLVYDELRRVAHRQLAAERPDHTLNTVALVHEAYVKLVGLDRIEWKGRPHFFATAAVAMRRILIDYAVRRRALKRGGGLPHEELDPLMVAVEERGEELLALDDALRRLGELNERQAKVVEYRFFAGMTIEEAAEALGVSTVTVKRDWAAARAWLNRELAA